LRQRERDRQAVIAGACEEVADPNTKARCIRQRQMSEESRRLRAERDAGYAERSRIAAEEVDRRRKLDAEHDQAALARGDCKAVRQSQRRYHCLQEAQRSAEERRTFTGAWLGQEELRTLIAGRTLELVPQEGGQAVVLYFTPNGEAFYRSGESGLGYRARGAWFIEGDKGLCTRGLSLPCLRVNRAENGALLGRYSTGAIQRITRNLDGDPTHTQAEVSRYYPKPLPAPGTARPEAADRSGVHGPSMSR
jgi:hypothetical protein